MSDGLNEYIISELNSYITYTKVWAKSYEDALEVKCGSAPGWPDNIYEVPEPVVLKHQFWNSYDNEQLIAVNGEFTSGHEYMKENGYLE